MPKGPYYPKGPKRDQNPATIQNSYEWNNMLSKEYDKAGSGKSREGLKYAAKAKALGTMVRLLKGDKKKG
jgi:hypothetical protein